eukprot:364815-Chlamydomonas_euryale.AAC.5
MMRTCSGFLSSYRLVDTHSYVTKREPGFSTRNTSPYTSSSCGSARRCASSVEGRVVGGSTRDGARGPNVWSCGCIYPRGTASHMMPGGLRPKLGAEQIGCAGVAGSRP